MELGALLLAFIIYLYLPHVCFKVAAENFIDLGKRVDSSEIEDVVSAVVPSAILNLQAYVVVRLISNIPHVRFPSAADWNLFVNIIFNDEGPQHFAAYLSSGYQILWPLLYLAILYGLTVLNGLCYGNGVVIGTYAEADAQIFPDALTNIEVKNVWDRLKQWISVKAFKSWGPIYREYRVWLMKFTLLEPWVYVRTSDGLLYHGRFVDYEKSGKGEVDFIELRSVSRYSRSDNRKLIESGVNPLKALDGTLHLKWERITDLIPVRSGHVEAEWKRLEEAASRNRPVTASSTGR